MKRSDSEIQRLVLQELKWDPRVDEMEVGVQVKHGVVTLAGRIGSLGKKVAAADAAHRVFGVLDVANDLEVAWPVRGLPSDSDLAAAVRETLRWNVFVDDTAVSSTVADGWVSLVGEVSEPFQREAAARVVYSLTGVRGVTNRIVVKRPKVEAMTIRSAIDAALVRQVGEEAKRIHVEVKGGDVRLTGTVRSWAEKRAAECTAAFAPGVLRVTNELSVDSYS
jgi:osmotically-inducible protein OsmY